MESTEQEKLVYASDKPDIGELAAEFQRCTPFAHGWNRVQDNEDTRFCRWDGQSTDGKKHKRANAEAFPWEGASDTRVNLVDAIISEHVAIQKEALRRSIALLKGVEPKDEEAAGYANKLLEWLTSTKMNDELMREGELSAQYQGTYGNFLLHPTWEREITLKRDPITLQKLVEIASQSPDGGLMMLAQLIANEDTEPQAVAMVQQYGKYIAQTAAQEQLSGESSDLFDNYEVSKKTAQKFVREMREGKQSSLPIPYICKNQPTIRALKLWEDVFVPAYVTDIQKAPRVFVREYYTEQELRSKAELDGWDKDWVDKAITKRGGHSTWTVSNSETRHVFVNAESGFVWQEAEEDRDQIEVIWAYQRLLDEDNVPSIYYTVFHADITKTEDGKDPLFAKHAPLGYAHNKQPFVPGPREQWHRSILSSRGIPEVLSSRQREIKVQRDSLVDWTSLSVAPPILVPSTGTAAPFVFAPNAKNPTLPGREPKQMELNSPGSPVAFELMERFEREVKEEMAVPHVDVPPARIQVKQQQIVNSILGPWTEAFQQVLSLIKQYMPDKTFMEITGSPTPVDRSAIDLEKDFILTFDVREMDDEHLLKRYKAIAEGILPYDREGVISSSKFVIAMLRALDPALANQITVDGVKANQQIVQRVENDFVNMLAGMPPRLTPDDNPTASAELQVAEGILQNNKKMAQAFATDPDFQEKVQKWTENRQFNIQQDQNKLTGRMGVAA